MPRVTPVSAPHEVHRHPALAGGHVVILSASRPKYPQSVAYGGGEGALQRALEHEGLDYEPTRGKFGEPEPSVIVHIRHPEQVEVAKDVARKLGQEAVVHSRGGQNQLAYVNGPNEGLATEPAGGYNFYESEPDDDYTMIPGPSGQPLGFFSYKLDFAKPLVPHAYAEAPQIAKAVLRAAVESYRETLLDLRARELKKYSFDVGSSGGGGGSQMSMGEESPEHKYEASYDSGRGNLSMSSSEESSEPTRKFEVKERGTVKHGPQGVHHDISAQQGAIHPSLPYPTNIAGGGSIKDPRSKVAKTTPEEYDRDAADRARTERDLEDEEYRRVPVRDPNLPPQAPQSGRVPSIWERAESRMTNSRAEFSKTTIALNDLLKSQAARGVALRKAGDPRTGNYLPGVAAKALLGLRPEQEMPKNPGPAPVARSLAQVRQDVQAGADPRMDPMLGETDAGGPGICDRCLQEIPEDQPAYIEGYSDDPDKLLCQNCAPPRIAAEERQGRMRHGQAQRKFQAGRSSQAALRREVEGAVEGATAAGSMLKREGEAEFLSKPPVSQAQRSAMGAAASGHSKLGIPKKVGEEFLEEDPGGKLPKHKKAEESAGDKEDNSPKLKGGKCSACGEVPVHDEKADASFCKCPGLMWAGQWKKSEFLSKPPVSEAQRKLVHARAGKGVEWAKEWAAEDKPGKLPERKEKKSEESPTDMTHGPQFTKMGQDFATSGARPDAPAAHPDHQKAAPGAVFRPVAKQAATRVPQGPYPRGMAMAQHVVKRSVFKRETSMHKDEFKPTRRYSVKLGKQEFYIDLKNASDPKRRVTETNPVKESRVPGGPETGWDTNAPKPRKYDPASEKERGTSPTGRANKPKPGPDQRNDEAPLITKAEGHDPAEEWEQEEPRQCPACGGEGAHMGNLGARKHFNCRNCGMWFSPREESVEKAEESPKCKQCGKPFKNPVQQQVSATHGVCADCTDENHRRATGKETKKAEMMGAPKAPKAPGMGSPKLPGVKPPKPPTAQPAPMGMGKALMPFSAAQEAVRRDVASQTPPRPAEPPAKATPRPPGEFDPEAFKPRGPVSSGLELAGPAKPKPFSRPGLRSPAFAKNIGGWNKVKSAMRKAGVPVSEGSRSAGREVSSEGSGSPQTSRITKAGIPTSPTGREVSSSGSGSPETSRITKAGIPVSEGSGSPERSVSSSGSGSPETSRVTKAELCRMCKKTHAPGVCEG